MAKKSTTSKYARILPSLERFISPDSERQDVINLVKAQLREEGRTESAVRLGETYVSLREEKNKLDAALSLIQLKIEAVEQLLIESKDANAEGWGQYGAAPNMMQLVTGAALRVATEVYSSVENYDVLRQFFTEHDMLRKLNPHYQTVQSLNKDRLMAGEPQLPGTKVTAKPKIVYYAAGTVAPEEPSTDDAFEF